MTVGHAPSPSGRRSHSRWLRLAAFALLLTCPLLTLSSDTENADGIVLLEIDGAIGPATSDYISRGLAKAQDQRAHLVIIRIDTPGGLDTSMRDIIQDIIAATVPVVGFVYPGGARAASAGAYILIASHVAAMAPATNVGAATPVQITGFPGGERRPPQEDKNGPEEPQKPVPHDTTSQKIINDAVAYIRGLAELRKRNADWAEKAVREAASLSAEEALANQVIDLVAVDLADLLAKLDGRSVNILGRDQVLATEGRLVQRLEPDWRANLLSIITNPNVAYILMLIGIYGLIYEFANPGMILPGVAGTICLLLALFAFQVLPINYAGLALMLLGISFMVGEVFVPSFGALGIGGVIAFVIGSIMLLDTDIPGYGISIPLIGFFALLTAALFMFVLTMAIKARQRPVVSGMEELLGSIGEAMADFETTGRVRVHSESWRARTTTPVQRGQKVRVTGIDGLELVVEPELIDSREE